MNKFILTLAVTAIPSVAIAAEPADSTSTQLDELVVQAAAQRQEPQKAVYLPDKLQKETALSATDLLNRMQIPQLRPGADDNPLTMAGENVAIYINYLPADKRDLEGMKTSDVQKVEYYDYPSDPRFQGKPHVVNFLLKEYDYGGYVKLYGNENFWTESGQLSFVSKIQYKKMTYDVYGGAFHYENDHSGTSMTEHFRLPQPDGTVNEFERKSDVLGATHRNRQYWATFRALWQSDRVSMRNSIGANWNHTPRSDQHGIVTYTPAEWTTEEYEQNSASRINSLSYYGDWYFQLPGSNSLNFTPKYTYSHTNQNSGYLQPGIDPIFNGAVDNTHELQGELNYSHNFGNAGSLGAYLIGLYSTNKTVYIGSANSTDRSKGWAVAPAVSYSLPINKVYINVNAGLSYLYTDFVGNKDHRLNPAGSLSVQYAPNQKNSFNASYNYSLNTPQASDVSPNIIKQNPLMSYTGNPQLKPYTMHSAYLSYTFTPSRKFNVSLSGGLFGLGNRPVYVYVASPTGILRTVQQNHSSFRNWGIHGYTSTSQLENKLQISGGVSLSIIENGAPYDYTKLGVQAWARAYYYVGNWYFGAAYYSPAHAYDGYMNGIWTFSKSTYSVQAGWSKKDWNIRASFSNFGSWNWDHGYHELKSESYDFRSTTSGGHAYFALSAAYTFGFGKEIKRGDEATRMSSSSSGILK